MQKVQRLLTRSHSKASERYVDVVFSYPNLELELSIPIEYRRTGTDIPDTKIDKYLAEVYEELNPNSWAQWQEEQAKFWKSKPGATTTKAFFDVLSGTPRWVCVGCELPTNPNWARRIQDLKEFGYTLATDTSRSCEQCNANKTHLMLLPLKRGGVSGYEKWSSDTRNRIIRLLKSYDAFEGKVGRKEGLLPDHKFPEIRWDHETRRESLNDLSDAEIVNDFQLLSNQRNQQKREVCRSCYQSGIRGKIFGIDFFYHGVEAWDMRFPKNGKAAEKGCIGCGWYDIQKWRKALERKLT